MAQSAAYTASQAPLSGFSQAVAVTLSDSTVYSPPPDAFMVGASGNVTIVDMNGHTTLIKNMTQGIVYPIRATKFKSSGTAATDLVALYY